MLRLKPYHNFKFVVLDSVGGTVLVPPIVPDTTALTLEAAWALEPRSCLSTLSVISSHVHFSASTPRASSYWTPHTYFVLFHLLLGSF